MKNKNLYTLVRSFSDDRFWKQKIAGNAGNIGNAGQTEIIQLLSEDFSRMEARKKTFAGRQV